MFSSTLAAWIPSNGNILRSWIMKAFHNRKILLAEEMRQAKSSIHLSFDMWTSSNSIAFVAVVAHYIDTNMKLQTTLIGLRRVIGSHSGEVVAEQVVQVIQEYGFEQKLGYFVLDNASSNDTCVEAILGKIRPDLIKKERRLRCIGHIINLAAQAFLYGKDEEAFTAEVYGASMIADMKKQLDIWRKKGPIGKLHNIVTFIRHTPQRRDQFRSIEVSQFDLDNETMKDLMVIYDNDTCWNSACNMIERALTLCHRIDAFCAVNQRATKRNKGESVEDDDGSVRRDTLTPGDWDTLKELYDLTKPLRDFTARMEGRATTGLYGALWEVLPAIELMVSEYKRFAAHYTALVLNNQYGEAEGEESDMETSYILLCINNALAKLMKYQELLPHSPAYAAAVAMNPTLRWEWMKNKTPHLLESSQAAVLRLWEKDYSSKVLPKPAVVAATRTAHEASTFDSFLQVDEDFDVFEATAPIDIYRNYCTTRRTPFSECPNVIVRWESCGIADDPVSQMAWDMIAIPAMSSECERVFSSAGRLVTPLRNRLKEDVIEASECLNAWYKQESA